MAEDLGVITRPATSAMAQIITDLVDEARGQAVTAFADLPPGEEGTVAVLLTADTAVGTVGIGMWTFVRDADGTVHAPGMEVGDG
ncbi:hypothetical protein [Streptomyces sp. NPDC047070]|uniref:hypothetical protein n=1 Tax=Streptomyces sp. NPDC047070 TaxID=3154923 RepID=UPI003456E890